MEAVFTKTEMNNEGNVNFHQNTRFIQKVLRLVLYLPIQKLTINETIFFKIQGAFEKYPNWRCIYQDRNRQLMKYWIFYKNFYNKIIGNAFKEKLFSTNMFWL